MVVSDESSRDRVRSGAVVHPLSRVAQRPCSRPGCPAPARATLTFAYARRQAWIEPLQASDEPQAYDLCSTHASRTRPPAGWELRDRWSEEESREESRHESPPASGVAPEDLGGDRTVAVLAAALRAVPDLAPEDAGRDDRPVDGAGSDVGASPSGMTQPELPVSHRDEPRPVPEDAASPVLGDGRSNATGLLLAIRDGSA